MNFSTSFEVSSGTVLLRSSFTRLPFEFVYFSFTLPTSNPTIEGYVYISWKDNSQNNPETRQRIPRKSNLFSHTNLFGTLWINVKYCYYDRHGASNTRAICPPFWNSDFHYVMELAVELSPFLNVLSTHCYFCLLGGNLTRTESKFSI